MTKHLIGLGRLSRGGVTPFNAEALPLDRYLMYTDICDVIAAKQQAGQ